MKFLIKNSAHLAALPLELLLVALGGATFLAETFAADVLAAAPADIGSLILAETALGLLA